MNPTLTTTEVPRSRIFVGKSSGAHVQIVTATIIMLKLKKNFTFAPG